MNKGLKELEFVGECLVVGSFYLICIAIFVNSSGIQVAITRTMQFTYLGRVYNEL